MLNSNEVNNEVTTAISAGYFIIDFAQAQETVLPCICVWCTVYTH